MKVLSAAAAALFLSGAQVDACARYSDCVCRFDPDAGAEGEGRCAELVNPGVNDTTVFNNITWTDADVYGENWEEPSGLFDSSEPDDSMCVVGHEGPVDLVTGVDNLGDATCWCKMDIPNTLGLGGGTCVGGDRKRPPPEPTDTPTKSPTTAMPTNPPTSSPSKSPTGAPSGSPTAQPSKSPIGAPSSLATIEGTVFFDADQDSFYNETLPEEYGLDDIQVELVCERDGWVMEGIQTSAADGTWAFEDVVPGRCRVKVLKPLDYEWSPVVIEGGNQIRVEGFSPNYDIAGGATYTVLVGVYQPATTTPATPLVLEEGEGDCADVFCPEPEEGDWHDCGWGIWNDCTCQCVCDPGLCLSANGKCYDGCLTQEDHNPYGGCVPGVDCPWYPSKLGEPHCESSANFAGVHGLRETAELCCKQHFGGLNQATCAADSKADVAAEEAKVAADLARQEFFYADQHGKQNCVFNSDYEDWMTGANAEHYLFEEAEPCCEKFYPARTDCPYEGEVTPKQVDYKPDPSEGYFYPHLSASNCRFGRNYPIWMKNSPKHYLYTTPAECCSVWYPDATDCPMAEDDGVQEGKFWVMDTAFFPNWKGAGCGHGNDYPEWMADPTHATSHLFKSAADCCDFWFPAETTKCQNEIVESSFGVQTGGPANYNGGTWYPSLDGTYQCLDGDAPEWMMAEGYKEEYVFPSHAECCSAHYCDPIRGIVQAGWSLTDEVEPGQHTGQR
ncbi:hypothetical protein ACHAXT_007722 [Thalassiosira profunda]